MKNNKVIVRQEDKILPKNKKEDAVSNYEMELVNLPKISNEIKEYAKIKSEISKNNKKCINKFISSYNNYSNLDEVINSSFDLGNRVIAEAIEFCVEVLIKYNIFEIDEKSFFNYYITSSKWSDSYDFIHEKYLTILHSEEEKDQHRTLRRQMREKLYGPSSSSVLANVASLNFGKVLDQANDSVKTLAVNTATNVAHGLFNLGAKAVSAIGAYIDKNAIFKDPNTLNTLLRGLTYDLDLIENITSGLIELSGSPQIYVPKAEEIQKSNSIISNTHKISDTDKRLKLLKSAIEIYPFTHESYIEMIKIDFNFLFVFKGLLDELQLDFTNDFHKLLLDIISNTNDYDNVKKLINQLDNYKKQYNDKNFDEFLPLIITSVNKALINKFNIRLDESNFVEENNLFNLYNSLIDSKSDLNIKHLDVPIIIEVKNKLEESFILKENSILCKFDNTDSGISRIVDDLNEYLNYRSIQIDSTIETKFISLIVDYVKSKINDVINQTDSNCFDFSKDLSAKFDYYESYLLSKNGLVSKTQSKSSFYNIDFINNLRNAINADIKIFIDQNLRNLLLKFNKLNSLTQVKIVLLSFHKICDKFALDNYAVLTEYIDTVIFNILEINPSSNYKTYSLEFLESRRDQCLEIQEELSFSNSKALQIIDTFILENKYLNAINNRIEILEVYGKRRFASYTKDFLLPYFDSFNMDFSKQSSSLKSQIIAQCNNFFSYRGRCSRLPFIIITSPLILIYLFQYELWFFNFFKNDADIMFPLTYFYSNDEIADFYLCWGLYIPLFFLFIMHWIICRRVHDLSELSNSHLHKSHDAINPYSIFFYVTCFFNFLGLFFIISPILILIYLCFAPSFQKPNKYGSFSSGQINPDDIF